jgi:AccI restriction endonuclease
VSGFNDLERAAVAASQALAKRGFGVRFGGADASDAKIRPPTDANSEFLGNRAMGDWAEQIVASALRQSDLVVTHYGAADDLQAGDDGFKAFYEAQVKEVRQHGKRPDLLVFASGTDVPASIAGLTRETRDAWVPRARAAIEVRSSKFKALQYMQVKAERGVTMSKSSVGKLCPSFTVKVEDLAILYRWVERHGVLQAYFQVFFDSCHAISVAQILELIEQWPSGMALERPRNSQGKPTILIPITLGIQVGQMREAPRFSAEVRETELGRVDAFVVPQGGALSFDRRALAQVLGLR